MSRKPLLGELLVQQNLVSQEIIDTALRVQVGGNRRLGYILVRMKEISADQLAETLAQQLNVPIIAIGEKFSPEVKKTLPRYLCRQYDVLPLALTGNNILQMAMSDPSDGDAISDLEHYTGNVIEPFLARHSDIDREIGRRIPLGLKDIITPRANTLITRVAAVGALAMVIALGVFTFDYMEKSYYGTISETDSQVMYKNHDLMLGVDKTGKVTILGHGAFSKGYYSVSFNNPEMLRVFLKNKEKDFSDKQRTWLDWAIKQADIDYSGNLVSNK